MLPVAHRTPDDAAACAALAEAGARCFEVDVQLADRGIVVSHWLPLFGVRGWLEHDGPRVRRHRRRSPDPLLADVLAKVPTDARVLLDPKEIDPARRRRLRDQLAEQIADPSKVAVSTADSADLEAYRAAGFITWRTVGDPTQLAEVLSGSVDAHEGLSIEHSLVTPETADGLHRVTSLLVAWTVNEVSRARQLVALGVGGVTSDNPDVLGAVASVQG